MAKYRDIKNCQHCDEEYEFHFFVITRPPTVDSPENKTTFAARRRYDGTIHYLDATCPNCKKDDIFTYDIDGKSAVFE